MTTETTIEKVIKEYRFTVVILTLLITGMFGVFAWTLLVYVPEVLTLTLTNYYSDYEVITR